MLIAITGRGSVVAVPFPPERQLIEIDNAFLSYKKIESVLGWRPTTSLQKGLAHTVTLY
jgi:nucleoside-diphosphate-sugar epimerase